MEPVSRLSELAVRLAHPVDQPPRVEIIDLRRLVEIISLDPAGARLLAIMLLEHAEIGREVPPLPKASDPGA